MFRERESWYAMSSAASSLRSSIRPSPAEASELAISSAALESPSAEMMAAFFCCSAWGWRWREAEAGPQGTRVRLHQLLQQGQEAVPTPGSHPG